MGERPTTRRRPFAMDINEGGKELLLSEGHAPASGATLPRLGEIERTKIAIAIARPRSAPPADKMTAPDGARLRSQSARARRRQNNDDRTSTSNARDPANSLTESFHAFDWRMAPHSGRPRTAPRRDGASPTGIAASVSPRLDWARPESEDTAGLGARLLILAFIYLS